MMKIVSILAIALVYTGAYGQNGEKNFIDQNYIEVTGTAEIEVVPNEIQITISVGEKDFKVKQSFEAYEKEMMAKLKEIGIPVEKELSVMDMNSRLKSSMIKRNEINAAKQYLLIVHDARTANQVFDEMEKIGITNMAVTKFDHSEIERYRREVKVNAIKAAKEKAGVLAAAIDQSIGRALYIIENSNAPFQVQAYLQSNTVWKEKEEFSGDGVVDFQKIRLKYSVMVRFELK